MTTETKTVEHTPGPWGIDDGPYILATTTSQGNRGTVVVFGKPGGGGHYWPAIGMGGISLDEAKANARLIAAAPDMKAALEEIVDAVESGRSDKAVGMIARAALAKTK